MRRRSAIALATVCVAVPGLALRDGEPAPDPAVERTASAPSPVALTRSAPPSRTTRHRPRHLFVSTGGSDRTGTGTSARPYRTLAKAASVVQPGDAVYARAGSYGSFTIRRSGTRSKPITFRSYGRETVSVDGTRADRSRTRAAVTILGSHVRLIGFHVRNPSGRGISALDVVGVVIRDNRVRETWAHPIIATGRHLVIQGNDVRDGALEHAGTNARGFWPGGISTWSRPSGRPSSDVVIRANRIRDTWGEGILPAHAVRVVIADNIVHDTWSANVYLTEVRHAIVEGNYLYSTDPRFNRNGRPADGIIIANEGAGTGGSPAGPFVQDILIRNNVVVRTGYGIWFWYDRSRTTNNSYRDVRIAHNLIGDAALAGILFEKVSASQARPVGNLLINNVFWGAAQLEDGDGWVSLGNWRGDVGGDPRLAAPMPGGSLEGFRPRHDSPLLGAGTDCHCAERDIAGAARPRVPTIGPFESPG
jgi:Right handed beta helix region/Protein of unknown function (DUF1565)